MENNNYLTVQELAKRWGISPKTVRANIADGSYPATAMGKGYKIPVTWVAEFEAKSAQSFRKVEPEPESVKSEEDLEREEVIFRLEYDIKLKELENRIVELDIQKVELDRQLVALLANESTVDEPEEPAEPEETDDEPEEPEPEDEPEPEPDLVVALTTQPDPDPEPERRPKPWLTPEEKKKAVHNILTYYDNPPARGDTRETNRRIFGQ